MRIIALILLAVSAVTIVPASGVALLPASSDADHQTISVLDVCNQHGAGLLSGLDLPFVYEGSSLVVRPCCEGRIDTLPSSLYVFIGHFELDRPPKV